ncbi:MAG: hypothetical protein HY236_07875 [Acidobacteria bacterium]|nr:hypothetical protein [Acidobacteriota bacterium]
MRRMFLLFLLAAILPACAWAQHSHGYLFVAPGGISGGGNTSATVHLGAGGEGILGKGIGVGAELGVVGPAQSFSDLVGVFSANGYYHFSRSGKADPFLTGGYSLLFRTGTANLANFGVGMNYWIVRRLGLEVEFRDHISTSGTTLHYWGIRVGPAFR